MSAQGNNLEMNAKETW